MANSLPLIVCFCVGIVSVIAALLRWLCKLIIHSGYVTYPGLTHIDTLGLCQRQQVTTREEEALLKSARDTLYTQCQSAAFLLHAPSHSSLSALSASTEVYSLSRTNSEEIISHMHTHTKG